MENVQATTGAKAGAKTVTKRRVKLISTDDTYTHIQRGTCGTVDLIDAMGTLHVSWDDGHRLGLIPVMMSGRRYRHE